jgi:hypothetical protein
MNDLDRIGAGGHVVLACFGKTHGGTQPPNSQQTCVSNGYTGHIKVGDSIDDDNEDQDSSIKPLVDGCNDRINRSHSSSYSGKTYDETDPRAVVIPVVDWSSDRLGSKVTVKGFAAVWLDSVDSQNSVVNAHFIRMVAPGAGPSKTAPDYGAHARARLVASAGQIHWTSSPASEAPVAFAQAQPAESMGSGAIRLIGLK